MEQIVTLFLCHGTARTLELYFKDLLFEAAKMATCKGACLLLIAVCLVFQSFQEFAECREGPMIIEELPTVQRSSFPSGFVFGSSTAAYQVNLPKWFCC